MSLTELKPILPEAGTPLYAAAREAIRAAVDRGGLRPGQQLPSTKAISTSLGVSLVTVHRALQELVASGVLRRGQGRGTFVHERYDQDRHASTGTRLGVVFHAECSLADSFHGQLFEGIRREATDRGIDLVLLRFGEDWRRECSGYLYVNPLPAQLDRPPRYSGGAWPAPVVVLGARTDRGGMGWIDTDNVAIGRIAAEHLASCLGPFGASRLLYVGDGSSLSNSVDRWEGFTGACRSGGLPFEARSDAVRPQGWRLDEGHQAALREQLERTGRCVVFAAGYYFALGVYRAAEELGLRVGEDVAVLGVDDPPSASYLSPPLSTISQPLIEVGRIAVRDATSAMGAGAVTCHTLDPTLIVRSSTVRVGSRARSRTALGAQ
jgi:DNA-binding LacI/PurR family transcriptional regulator